MLTYAGAAAANNEQQITAYKSATFHTVGMDNIYPYPFEDIPHLLITCR